MEKKGQKTLKREKQRMVKRKEAHCIEKGN